MRETLLILAYTQEKRAGVTVRSFRWHVPYFDRCMERGKIPCEILFVSDP